MKSQINFGVPTICLILICIGCHRESQQLSTIDTVNRQGQISSRTINCFCSLSLHEENDFNFVGQIHNEIICEYYQIFGEEEDDLDIIISRLDSIAEENENYLSIKDSNHISVDKNLILNGMDDFENQFENIVKELNLSDSAEVRLNNLVNYLFSLTGQEQMPTYSGVNVYLNEFEEDIIDDISLFTERDIRVLMSSTSTAKYSLCFWYNFDIADEESTLGEIQKRAKWLRVLVTVAADAVGAAVGAIPAAGTGGVAGSAIVGSAAAASTAAWNITNPNSK